VNDRARIVADVGRATLALTVAAAQLLVDPAAEAAFDAPKRLATVLGVAVATVVLASMRRPFDGGGRSRTARLAAALAAFAAAGVVVAAMASPRPEVARDAVRSVALLALAVPLGASALLDGAGGRWVLGAFLAAATLNAVVSLAEHATGSSLFALEAVAGRGAAGGLVGNEGQLALLLALALVAAIALACGTARRGRIAAGAIALPLAAGVLVNGSVTALLAAGAGSATVLALRFRARALAPIAIVAAVALASVVAVPALRARANDLLADARAGSWDDVTTNRLGPWAAAIEMTRARPLVGFGPGTYGAEFVPHRLAAEIRLGRRLTTPALTSSYAHAHSEPLQAAAEWGLPAAASALLAAALVLGGLLATALRAPAGDDPELLVLGGTLVATAVGALTWFPLQQTSMLLPALVAVGRAWRRLG
jgi:O-antigen ligase